MEKIMMNELESIARRVRSELDTYKGMLMVCAGTGCVSAGCFAVRDALNDAVKTRNLDSEFLVVSTGCNGFCAVGPIVVVQPDGIFYQKVTPNDVDDIVEQHLVGGTPVERLMHVDPTSGQTNRLMEQIKFFSKQQLIALCHR